ncbi:MAG: universal stress protein [Burkholderiales bacterium]|nr:universal stress protein [Burkholderiales bacterium]
MFRNILVPTDGSTLSKKAVRKAVVLAAKLGARVTGFHVAPAYRLNVYADYVPPDLLSPREFNARTKAVAVRHLDVVKKEAARAGVSCACYYVNSDLAADAILKAAKRYKCDAIVMASHGRSGLGRILLGSETNKVLANTRLPVLVLR